MNRKRFSIYSATALLILTTLACATLLTPISQSSTPQSEPTTLQETHQPTQVSIHTNPENLGELFAPFWEVWDILHEEYVEQPLDDQALVEGAIQAIGGPLEDLPDAELARQYAIASETPQELQSLFIPFWQTWIASESPKDVSLMRHAIRGMIAALGDDHTSYIDPDQYIQTTIEISGEYEGIGAWVDTTSEYLTIVSPMPGSPAEKAGLLPGDEIIKVDGEDMTGIDGDLVVRRVLGPAGSKVVLTVRRKGESELLEFEITRARIVIPTVEGEMLEDQIAYIRLMVFGQNSADDFRQTLEELLAENPRGLVFDLRNNGGGLLRTAVQIASEFIDKGVILYEEYGDGSRDTHRALRGGTATEIPLVVLINEGSASASELVAGAIQDHGRGLLVGTRSFGKGSIQTQTKLISEDSAVRVTIAYWKTPNERLIHKKGITPDFVVEMTEEDIEADRDPQLEKAIELLLNPPSSP